MEISFNKNGQLRRLVTKPEFSYLLSDRSSLFSDSELEDGSDDGILWIGEDVDKNGDDDEGLSWTSERAVGSINLIWINDLYKNTFE